MFHQARRSEIAAKLKLNVGPPQEEVVINGKLVPARDDVGLALDTRLYAKQSCTNCFGRGIVQTMTPLTSGQVKHLRETNPANEGLMRERKPGKFSVSDAQMCGCARLRFQKRRAEFINVLLREKLARITGTRVNARGDQENTVELL